MNMLLKLSKEAIRYKGLYILAILATLCLTGVNLSGDPRHPVPDGRQPHCPEGPLLHDRHCQPGCG